MHRSIALLFSIIYYVEFSLAKPALTSQIRFHKDLLPIDEKDYRRDVLAIVFLNKELPQLEDLRYLRAESEDSKDALKSDDTKNLSDDSSEEFTEEDRLDLNDQNFDNPVNKDVLRRWSDCRRKAAKICTSACMESYRNTCYAYSCRSSMKRTFRRECKENCRDKFRD